MSEKQSYLYVIIFSIIFFALSASMVIFIIFDPQILKDANEKLLLKEAEIATAVFGKYSEPDKLMTIVKTYIVVVLLCASIVAFVNHQFGMRYFTKTLIMGVLPLIFLLLFFYSGNLPDPKPFRLVFYSIYFPVALSVFYYFLKN